MAVTKEVTVVSVTDSGDAFGGKMLSIAARLVLKRDGAVILEKEFTGRYKNIPELTLDQSLAIWAREMKALMQDAIGDYVREQALLNHAKLATAASWVGNNLDITGV